MKNSVWALAVIALLFVGGGCAGTSTAFGVYGSSGYYPRPYYDPFWESPFPPYYSPYNIISIDSALRLGPSPIQGRFTLLGRIPIHIARIPIATDGSALDAIIAGRQIGRRTTLSGRSLRIKNMVTLVCVSTA
jgi:hypothetical protein